MGAFYETIPASLIKWILEQRIFWVATAPLSSLGHINISPKGGPYFGIVNPTTFWYLDLTGSGIETLSHLHEPGNGRITVQFNAFKGPPSIVRLFGNGEVLEYGTTEFKGFVEKNEVVTIPGTRSIVVVHIHQVGSSCGFSVPFYEFKEWRTELNEFAEKRVASDMRGNRKDGLERYWAHKNALSMDGLPGMKRGVKTGKNENVKPIKKMVGPYADMIARVRVTNAKTVPVWHLILVAILSFCLGISAIFFAPQMGLLLH